MFDATCHRRGARVLIPTQRILSTTNDDGGILVRYRCWCGDVCEWRPGHHGAQPTRHGEVW